MAVGEDNLINHQATALNVIAGGRGEIVKLFGVVLIEGVIIVEFCFDDTMGNPSIHSFITN